MARKIFILFGVLIIAISIPITVLLFLKRTQIIKEAAVPEGLTTITLDPQTGTFRVGETFDVKVNIYTAGIGVSVVTAYLTYGYEQALELEVLDADSNPTNGTQIKTSDLPQLNYITNDVTVDEPTKKVIIRLAAMIANPEEPYLNTSEALFGTITFKALVPVESRTISFDQELSRITNAETAQDTLLIPTNGFYTITGETTPLPPKITGFSPTSGKVGTTVAIEGENFGKEPGTSTVKFSGTKATEFDAWNEKNISAKVPKGAKTGKIAVTTEGGTAESSEDFEVLEEAEEEQEETSPPVISSFAPKSGEIGTRVTISGDHFGDEQGTNKVEFNEVEATDIVNWTNVLLEVRVPLNTTTGKISVMTDQGTAISDKDFEVEEGGGTSPEDITAPTISNVLSLEITKNSAKITWKTDEAATSQVEYGTTPSYGNLTVKDTSLITDHTHLLTALTPATIYHYRVKSEDASGNPAVSTDYTLTTAAAAASEDTTSPIISDVSAAKITANTVEISWSTDEAATSQVEYGETQTYGSSTEKDTTLAASHTVSLSGLKTSTLYHYRVVSEDSSGNSAASSNYTFTTSKEGTGGTGEELPETGISSYKNIATVTGSALIFLGFFLPRLVSSFSRVTRKSRLKRFERKIRE